jgi:hypothetical protein
VDHRAAGFTTKAAVMKLLNPLFCIFLAIFLTYCNRQENENSIEPPEGCINLSDLLTRQDYYLPFALLNNKDNIRLTVLNNDTIIFSNGEYIEFKENGFFELILYYNDSKTANDTFLFTTITAEREFSEWGIRAWVPFHNQNVLLNSEDIDVFYPHQYTDLIKVPFIFYIRESGLVKPVYCEGRLTPTGEVFRVKQGTGSINVAASKINNQVSFTIGGRPLSLSLSKATGQYLEFNGTISSEVVIPANSLVKVTGDLLVTSSGSLSIGQGSVILIDEGVDINLEGPLIFTGSSENPVFVTCSREDRYWGGFITRTAAGTLGAVYTIFCQSGYHDSEGYNWGHSGRQALFYTENSTITLNHCFILDNIGQIFYPQNSTLTLDNILVQRAQTGGQINNSYLILRNSIFTDFPDDSDVFMDEDNDALYLSASDAEIANSVFMYAKDDGLDSGNEQGGTINLTNCRFEACFHEGAALSSGNNAYKNHHFTGCVFTNCGQGLELGFSSPNHVVIAENCWFEYNGIGVRYGDNYTWSEVEGKMIIKNSWSLFNDRDVWNMVRMRWRPVLKNLIFENTTVSRFCPQYPDLKIKGN